MIRKGTAITIAILLGVIAAASFVQFVLLPYMQQ